MVLVVTWGRLIDVDTATFLDRNDPNYDSNKIVWCSHGYFVEIVLLFIIWQSSTAAQLLSSCFPYGKTKLKWGSRTSARREAVVR
ncbi:hypothetical protein VPH35_128893 [Triticum aestivum]